MALSPQALAKQLLAILYRDREETLLKIDDYLHGRHDDPYMPDTADDEYKLLAKRSVFNMMPLIVGAPSQALYVDSFRRSAGNKESVEGTGSANHWQRSRLDARQHAVHRGALGYGHSFTVTEKTKRGVITRGLSALRTSALYEDPANDLVPYAALTVKTWPKGDSDGETPGVATMWVDKLQYAVTFKEKGTKVGVGKGKAHGASENPVTRFAAEIDLEGRTTGVIAPAIVLQDRINQTIFDLLVAQTYGSFKVRYATGMAPPLQMVPQYEDPDDITSDIIGWTPKIDPDTGQPVPANVNLSAKRFLFAPDAESRFGTLDATSLEGYIAAIEMGVKHLSAITQVPPHYLLGQMVNLAAEALDAAETSLSRLVTLFKSSFGESWERVDRLAAELEGDEARANDIKAEALWRDMESRSLSQAADALGKLHDQLGVPSKGLWPRIPGVTQTELDSWDDLRTEEDPASALAEGLARATGAKSSLQISNGQH